MVRLDRHLLVPKVQARTTWGANLPGSTTNPICNVGMRHSYSDRCVFAVGGDNNGPFLEVVVVALGGLVTGGTSESMRRGLQSLSIFSTGCLDYPRLVCNTQV